MRMRVGTHLAIRNVHFFRPYVFSGPPDSFFWRLGKEESRRKTNETEFETKEAHTPLPVV